MRRTRLGNWALAKIVLALRRLDALSGPTRVALSLMLLAITALASELSGVQGLPASFHDLSRLMVSRATPFVFAFVCFGVAAGLLARDDKAPPSGSMESTWPRVSRGLVHGGAALFAALTLIGGVKAVERFSIAEGPQVVFIGSGTVHRFLFGAADGALRIELGVPLGEHGTKFWAFEGTSSDGLRIAAYVYDHRSRSGFEDRVPVIGMASADVLKQHDDEVTWTECSNDTCGEQYFHANMHPANSEANNFAVVPVAIDVRPNWYVAGCDALRVAPRLRIHRYECLRVSAAGRGVRTDHAVPDPQGRRDIVGPRLPCGERDRAE